MIEKGGVGAEPSREENPAVPIGGKVVFSLHGGRRINPGAERSALVPSSGHAGSHREDGRGLRHGPLCTDCNSGRGARSSRWIEEGSLAALISDGPQADLSH